MTFEALLFDTWDILDSLRSNYHYIQNNTKDKYFDSFPLYHMLTELFIHVLAST